eukprot:797632-Pyramimonas_sp.AAC.1
MSQWRCPHASPPPSTALRGPIGSPTECPSGGVHMRALPPPTAAFRGPRGRSTECPSGGVHMRLTHT